MRRALRGNTVEQNTQRLRLQASGEPEGQDLLGLATVEGGALALAGVDAQLAKCAVFFGRQLVLSQGLVGALVLVGVGVLLWPIALAMLAGVIVAFGVANLYIILLAIGRAHQALSLADTRGGLISSFGLTLLELGALAALRSFLAATYGFSWGV